MGLEKTATIGNSAATDWHCNENCENRLQTSEEMEVFSNPSERRKTPVRKMMCIRHLPWVVIVISVIFCFSLIVVPNTSHPCPSCPSGWITYERKCDYFSEDESSWNASQSNCSSSGASLATIDTKQEWDFIMRYKRPADHWIGLHREINQPWRWTNGSNFNSSLFQIGANGYCAFLDKDEASSTLCETERNWICSKSLSTF